MIFHDLIEKSIKELKNLTLINNFPEDMQNSLISEIIDIIKSKRSEEFEIHRIYEDTPIKKLEEFISDINLFSNKILLFIYNFTSSLSALKNLKIPEDLFIFIFTDEKTIKENKEISIIQFPKDIDYSDLINKFLANNNIKFETKEVEDLLKSYFNGISSTLEKVLEDILIYLKKTNTKTINKELALQFLTSSLNFSFFNIINSFFSKDKNSFFYQYIQFVESENDFFSFFLPFLKEVKTLTIISSILSENKSFINIDKSAVLNYFNKIQYSYNPYRFQYDIKKIENFGKDKFSLLLEFLISIDLYSRYYDKQSAQKLFEIGINQFI